MRAALVVAVLALLAGCDPAPPPPDPGGGREFNLGRISEVSPTHEAPGSVIVTTFEGSFLLEGALEDFVVGEFLIRLTDAAGVETWESRDLDRAKREGAW